MPALFVRHKNATVASEAECWGWMGLRLGGVLLMISSVEPPALGGVIVAEESTAAPPERFAARQLGHFFSLSLSWRARPFAVAMALGVSAHSLAASSLGSDG